MKSIFYVVFFIFSGLPLLHGQIRDGALTQSEQATIKRAREDLRSDDSDIVYYAACNLIHISHRRSLEILKEHMEKGTATAKRKIIKALGDRRNDGVLDAIDDYLVLLEKAFDSDDQRLHEHLVHTLIALESPQVASLLTNEVKSHPKDMKRMRVVVDAFSSMRLNDIKTIGCLITAGENISDTKMKEQLLKALNTTLFQEFRSFAEAKRWFAKNRDRSFEEVMKEHWAKVREKLKEAEKEREEWRRHCIEAYLLWLRSLSSEERLEQVLKIIDGKGNTKVMEETEIKEFAIRELGRLKAKKHYSRVIPYLQSGENVLVIAAIEALGELGVKEASASVAPMVKSPSADIRLVAVKTLVRLSFPAKEILQQLELEEESNIIEALVNAVNTLNITGALPVLFNRMFTEAEGGLKLKPQLSPELRKETVKAVGHLASQLKGGSMRKRAVTALIASLTDADASVRFYSCEGLGMIGASVSQAPLVIRLKDDESPGVRAAAARALGRIENLTDRTVEVLKDALTSKEKEVVVAATAALRSQCGLTAESDINTRLLKEVAEHLMSKKLYEQLITLLSLPKERLDKMDKEKAAEVASLLLLSAKAYESIKDLRKATATFRHLLPYLKGKQAIDARSELAGLLVKQGKYAEAISEYDTLLKVSSERQTEFWHRKLDAIEKIMEKDRKAAIQHIKASLETTKQSEFPQEIKERLKKIAKKAGLEYPPSSPK